MTLDLNPHEKNRMVAEFLPAAPFPSFVNLPKVALHDHLDGGLRPATLVDLAAKAGIGLPHANPSRLARFIRERADSGSLPAYLSLFGLTVGAMASEEALHRVALEAVEDLAADGVRLAELRFAPLLHVSSGLSPTAVMDAVLAGLADGAAKTGMAVGTIVCALRNLDDSREAAALALRYQGRGVVGFDLAGPEIGWRPSLHSYALGLCREAGLPITIHAGEADGEESILDALDCGIRRMGHGTALRSGNLKAALRERKVAIEACLTSNLQTRACLTASEHPFPVLLAEGLTVIPCTDNRLMSGTTHSLEMSRLAATFDLAEKDFLALFKAGVAASFLPESVKATLLSNSVRSGN